MAAPAGRDAALPVVVTAGAAAVPVGWDGTPPWDEPLCDEPLWAGAGDEAGLEDCVCAEPFWAWLVLGLSGNSAISCGDTS